MAAKGLVVCGDAASCVEFDVRAAEVAAPLTVNAARAVGGSSAISHPSRDDERGGWQREAAEPVHVERGEEVVDRRDHDELRGV